MLKVDNQESNLVNLRVSLNLLEGATGCYDWEAGFVPGGFVLNNPKLFSGDSYYCYSNLL